ncbi:hypothetical protein G4B88_007111 [Cannabis sativa]|uniref:Uncharacterized protein n=1 Tax=Cannabis sativa TaxID=3483 RepID=A0A7J6GNH0_CANSA|nr:hypothetical protein G4B88_007111 [Cannabis sativa]
MEEAGENDGVMGLNLIAEIVETKELGQELDCSGFEPGVGGRLSPNWAQAVEQEELMEKEKGNLQDSAKTHWNAFTKVPTSKHIEKTELVEKWQTPRKVTQAKRQAQNNLLQYQRRVSWAYDKLVRPRTFQEGYMVLKAVDHVMRGMHATKFVSNWEGPYIIKEIKGSGYCTLLDTSTGMTLPGVALETQDTIFSNSLTIKSNMSLKLRIQTGATVAQEYSVE